MRSPAVAAAAGQLNQPATSTRSPRLARRRASFLATRSDNFTGRNVHDASFGLRGVATPGRRSYSLSAAVQGPPPSTERKLGADLNQPAKATRGTSPSTGDTR